MLTYFSVLTTDLFWRRTKGPNESDFPFNLGQDKFRSEHAESYLPKHDKHIHRPHKRARQGDTHPTRTHTTHSDTPACCLLMRATHVSANKLFVETTCPISSSQKLLTDMSEDLHRQSFWIKYIYTNRIPTYLFELLNYRSYLSKTYDSFILFF